MYRLFKLREESIDWKHFGDKKKFLTIGEKETKQKTFNIADFVRNGKIDIADGEEIIGTVFPALHKDVFISHSHNDMNLTYSVAGILKTVFDLSVFIDKYFWGSADDLLESIDEEHCKIGVDRYSYSERNLTTSHVHTMLSTAIMRAIDQCEMILFLGTDNSAMPDIDNRFDSGEYTMSPWIYQEMLFTSLIKTRDWEWYRGEGEKGKVKTIRESFEVKYELPDMVELSSDDLISWETRYINNKFSMPNHYNALNYLYHIKNEMQPINS